MKSKFQLKKNHILIFYMQLKKQIVNLRKSCKELIITKYKFYLYWIFMKNVLKYFCILGLYLITNEMIIKELL